MFNWVETSDFSWYFEILLFRLQSSAGSLYKNRYIQSSFEAIISAKNQFHLHIPGSCQAGSCQAGSCQAVVRQLSGTCQNGAAFETDRFCNSVVLKSSHKFSSRNDNSSRISAASHILTVFPAQETIQATTTKNIAEFFTRSYKTGLRAGAR